MWGVFYAITWQMYGFHGNSGLSRAAALNSELAAAHALLSAVVEGRVMSHVVMQHLDLI